MSQALALSKEEVVQELLLRHDAQDGLIDFTTYTSPGYEPAQHHHMIAEALQRVERGETKRLMLFMPPRHGKSELASRRFPAWCLGRNPHLQIISASYNSELASDFGREVRNLVASQEYRNVFEGVELAADSQSANRWHTNSGGVYTAAGVGSGITGRGANLGIVDDPVKDREEADSETVQHRVWDWYRSTFYTRLMPDAAIVVIMTRWHDLDLAGRLLEEQEHGGDQWDIIELPALAKDEDPMGREQGAALWPEWYDGDRLDQIRRVVGSREWASLYQQDPQAEQGTFFLREWIQYWDDLPNDLQIYGASDYAVKDGEGDYTVHGIAGVDPNQDLFILDIWREQASSDVWIDALLDLVEKWRPLDWAEESGQIRASLDPFIQARMAERRVFFNRIGYPSVANKRNRAQAIRGRMSQGKVFLPKGAPWVDELESELLRFDAGRYDDQVDVMSLFGRMLSQMQPAGELLNFDARRHVRRLVKV